MNYKKLENILEHEFRDKELLKRALTHRSYRTHDRNLKSNERLEFLGDAVLEIVVSTYLFDKYPDTQEGKLTKIRSALVRTETIAQAVISKGINEFILMSKSEKASGGDTKPYILANTYEAIVGAIYLDGGYMKALKFIYDTIIPKTEHIVKYEKYRDPKSHLQELTQSKFHQLPKYVLVDTHGPAHEKEFEVEVHIKGKKYAKGRGNSKQAAEEEAAKKTIKKLK
jgi:ribonuclease-3